MPSDWASDRESEIDRAARTVARVILEHNRLAAFTPEIDYDRVLYPERHTPAVRVSLPWPGDGALYIQTPEYSWAKLPGDEEFESPLFYGEEMSNAERFGWDVRFPPLEKPLWKPRADGGLELDVRLEGGYVQRFQVIPRDRMVEIRFGVTNDSEIPIVELYCQLCPVFREAPGLDDQAPETVSMLCDGEVVDWTSFGQDLAWMEAQRDPGSGRIVRSCFFRAPTKQFAPEGWPAEPLQRRNTMDLARPVDFPAVVKSDREGGRHVLVYTPFGRNAFFNARGPCAHSNIYTLGVAPGETRWANAYFALFEGDLESLLRDLAREHELLERREGYLIP